MHDRRPNTRGLTLAERLDFYTERTEGCWLFTGTVSKPYGYGVLGADGRQLRAHRVAYALAHPDVDMADVDSVDHLCHTAACGTAPCVHRLCVNPAHLLGTTREGNTMRGESPAARNARKDRCAQGHAFDGERVTPAGRVGRKCLVCQREASERYRERRRRASGQ